MKTREGILAGGNWIVDKVKFIDVYPREETLANIRSESIANGGSPFNLLCDLSALGAPFPLAGVGLIGDDADGCWILAQCATRGIDAQRLLTRPDSHTSYTDVMTVCATGRRTFFHQRGANALLDAEHFDFTTSRARIFHLGYLLLLDRLDLPDAECGTVAARVLRRARAEGLKTSVDVVSEDSDRFAGIVLPALPHVDYCILNEFELERTTGIRTRRDDGIDLPAIAAATARLIAEGVREWVIVHFPEGACARSRDGGFATHGSVRLPPGEIVSGVGAGDAFAAGLLHGLHESVPIETALRQGVTAAAACLKGAGSSDGVHAMEICLRLGEKYGFRELANPAATR